MLKYVARTLNLGLVCWKNFEDNIVGYFNLDYTRLKDRKKSIKVYIFMFASRPIFYFSEF